MDRWWSVWQRAAPFQRLRAACLAIVCVVAATVVRIGFGIVSPDSAVFATYYSATLVAALVGGPLSGSIAMVLGGVIAYWLFVPPEWGLGLFPLDHLVSLVLYSASSAVIIWAAESYRGLVRRLREEQDRRQLFNDELAHRLKNMLASVQAIVGQSLGDQKGVLEKVSGRIAAFSATNDLLTKSEAQSANLREILATETAAYSPSHFRLQEGDIQLSAGLAILLTLIFHELMTNAAKYGALSTPAGRIDVSWSIVAGQVVLQWIENGGPSVAIPARQGFGTKLLTSGLKQFQGRAESDFQPAGFRCRLSFPLTDEISTVQHNDRSKVTRRQIQAHAPSTSAP